MMQLNMESLQNLAKKTSARKSKATGKEIPKNHRVSFWRVQGSLTIRWMHGTTSSELSILMHLCMGLLTNRGRTNVLGLTRHSIKLFQTKLVVRGFQAFELFLQLTSKQALGQALLKTRAPPRHPHAKKLAIWAKESGTVRSEGRVEATAEDQNIRVKTRAQDRPRATRGG
jgi:hypothetical protein